MRHQTSSHVGGRLRRVGPARATIKEVAERAGVSITTVSRVLNGEAVGPERREQVVAAMDALHYRPAIAARNLAGPRSYLIALLLGRSNAAPLGELQLAATLRCRSLGYHLVVEALGGARRERAASVSELLARAQPDGLILAPPVCDDAEVLAVLDRAGSPYVRLAPRTTPDGEGAIHADEQGAVFQLASRLLALGHRRLAFLSIAAVPQTAQPRLQGYLAALRAGGLEIDPGLIARSEPTFTAAAAAADLLLERERPTAILASNDEMAAGAMSAAARRGLRVPEDLSVAGCDDAPIARVVWPQLSTARRPLQEMAALAVDRLVEGASPHSASPPRAAERVAFTLVERGSTAPPRT